MFGFPRIPPVTPGYRLLPPIGGNVLCHRCGHDAEYMARKGTDYAALTGRKCPESQKTGWRR